jgi:hypothetical protein
MVTILWCRKAHDRGTKTARLAHTGKVSYTDLCAKVITRGVVVSVALIPYMSISLSH